MIYVKINWLCKYSISWMFSSRELIRIWNCCPTKSWLVPNLMDSLNLSPKQLQFKISSAKELLEPIWSKYQKTLLISTILINWFLNPMILPIPKISTLQNNSYKNKPKQPKWESTKLWWTITFSLAQAIVCWLTSLEWETDIKRICSSTMKARCSTLILVSFWARTLNPTHLPSNYAKHR